MTTVRIDRPVASSVGFGNVVRSEWTKLRSLRSTWVCAGLLVVMTVGVAVAMGARWAHQDGALPPDFDATNVVLSGVYLAQLVVGTVGALAMTSEYSTGLVRATFTAVPQRRAVLAAKAIVVGGATLMLGEIASFTSFGVGQALLVSKHAGASLGDPGALRAVVGAGLFLTAIALLGLGLGGALRVTAGAVSALFGLLFALDIITQLLPTTWRADVVKYLPLNAGSQVFTVRRPADVLNPWAGLGVLSLYAVAALLAAFVLVDVRDA